MLDYKQFEREYHDQIRFELHNRFVNRHPWSSILFLSGGHKACIHGKMSEGSLHISVEHTFEPLNVHINDIIDLNWNINKLKKTNEWNTFKSKYDLTNTFKATSEKNRFIDSEQIPIQIIYNFI